MGERLNILLKLAEQIGASKSAIVIAQLEGLQDMMMNPTGNDVIQRTIDYITDTEKEIKAVKELPDIWRNTDSTMIDAEKCLEDLESALDVSHVEFTPRGQMEV